LKPWTSFETMDIFWNHRHLFETIDIFLKPSTSFVSMDIFDNSNPSFYYRIQIWSFLQPKSRRHHCNHGHLWQLGPHNLLPHPNSTSVSINSEIYWIHFKLFKRIKSYHSMPGRDSISLPLAPISLMTGGDGTKRAYRGKKF
jgi:hypothetical protein